VREVLAYLRDREGEEERQQGHCNHQDHIAAGGLTRNLQTVVAGIPEAAA